MAIVIDEELLASVRVLLGETGDDLSDAVLTDPLVGGAAETAVLAAVGDPPYAERPEPEQAAIRTAVAYLTAAYALRTTRADGAVTSERFSQQYTVQYAASDRGTLAAELEAAGWRAIAHLRETGRGVAYFGTARGRRGVF